MLSNDLMLFAGSTFNRFECCLTNSLRRPNFTFCCSFDRASPFLIQFVEFKNARFVELTSANQFHQNCITELLLITIP